MFGTDSLSINALGHLTLGGADIPALAEKYGTPLYLMDEGGIRKACRDWLEAGRKQFGEKFLPAFASKAFCVSAMYRLLSEEGFGADVVSGGELYTAHRAGFDMQKILYHGNNKTEAELAEGLDYGVGRFVVDNQEELRSLEALCAARNQRAGILLRVTPGVEAHTHQFIRTGQIDSKFGMAIETGAADEGVRIALSCPHLDLLGLHCHIGSQILEEEPYAAAAEVMTEYMAHIRAAFGIGTRELNIGGGFGVRYTAEDDPRSPEACMSALGKALKEACIRRDLELPTVMIEPGRSIVAPYGVSVYTVGTVRTIPGYRTYVSVDGGMTDNPRYILYGAKYEFVVPARANQERTMTVTVAGRNCESGDLLGENVPIQPVVPGDLLCTLTTGAYCYSMASNYNRVPRPAVVFIREGADRLVVRRESLEDLVRLDVL